jgi:hypothetical protein
MTRGAENRAQDMPEALHTGSSLINGVATVGFRVPGECSAN